MGGKLIIFCLLLASLCDFSTGAFRFNPFRRRTVRLCRVWSFGRRCKKPVIVPMRPTTPKPTEATTQPRVILNPVPFHSSGLPYCTPRDVNAVLRPSERRTKRAVTWPYECRYASILEQSVGEYQFIWPIYDCCSKCSFPDFSTCVAKRSSPDWLCPSNGLHCIVGCVNKHNPATQVTKPVIIPGVVNPDRLKPGGLKPAPKPDGGKPNKCEKVEIENGKRCVRKLCVPLNYKP